MAAANTSAVSRLRSFVECSICLETLNDPRILPCQHSFCLRCLQGIWVSKQPNDTVHCPFCRETFVIPEQGISGIQRDHRGNEIRDIYELENVNRSDVCDIHNKPQDIYCLECKKIICASCLIREHNAHNVDEICEFLDKIRKEMKTESEKLSAYKGEMDSNKFWLDEYDNWLSMEISATEEVINRKATELRQRIEQQRLLLVEELCSIRKKQVREVMKEREAMSSHSAEIARVRNLCDEIALTTNPIELSNAMTGFRTACVKLADGHQVQLERPLPSTVVSFQEEEVQPNKNIIGSIMTVNMRLMKRLEVSNICGLTKLDNKIYVLRDPSNFLISVYEDQNPFRLQSEIDTNEITIASDIASSEKLKCLYVTDSVNNCIWKITVDDHRVTRWLSDIGDPFTLSVTCDDHILNLRDGKHHSQLEIYSSDANIIRILPLRTAIHWPLHAVQKPDGQFIIMHKANAGNGGLWVISQLASDGKIISLYKLYIGQYVNYPWHIYLDFEKDRLFLASCSEHGVILLDYTSRDWKKIRLTPREIGSCEGYLCCHCSHILLMHYDSRKKQLLIGRANIRSLSIVELN